MRRKQVFETLLKQKDTLVLKSAFSFLCNELGITPEQQDLISVEIEKRVAEGDGLCQGRYTKDGKLKDIKITLKSYSSSYGLVHSLAHELVHARQHLRGEFTFKEVKAKWLFFNFTKTIRLYKGEDFSSIPYFEQPFEVEAFILSDQLLMSFMDHIKQHTAVTDMIFKKNTGGLMSDTKEKQEQEFPRDFNLDFIDPHGDVDTTGVEDAD